MNAKKWVYGLSFLGILIALSLMSSVFVDWDVIIYQISSLNIYNKTIAMIILIVLQIVVAFLPGEPLELACGYIFGPFFGTVVCLIGSIIGTVIVYFLVKTFGNKLIRLFFSQEKIDETNQLIESKKGIKWLFILFLIPGTPKDIMTYVVSLSTIPVWKWLLITSIGRIPSIVTSTFVTGFYKSGDFHISIITIIITIILVLIGITIQRKRGG